LDLDLTAAETPPFEVWDDRLPAVLIHGSLAADPASTWALQRPLAAERRLLIAHRRGYGRALPRTESGFETDIADLIALLGGGAHLVGFSYGGVIALLAAARRPELIRSLAVIEPPAFGLALDREPVRELVAGLATLLPTARFTPENYWAAFLTALTGVPREPRAPLPEERQAAIAARAETPPAEAPVDLAALAVTPFPKLVFSGDWHPAMEAVADVLETHLPAERAVIPGAGHAVQQTGLPFNERLRSFWLGAKSR
jgi:pimeloyl-ACP methyl ester carboxylesterase